MIRCIMKLRVSVPLFGVISEIITTMVLVTLVAKRFPSPYLGLSLKSTKGGNEMKIFEVSVPLFGVISEI